MHIIPAKPLVLQLLSWCRVNERAQDVQLRVSVCQTIICEAHDVQVQQPSQQNVGVQQQGHVRHFLLCADSDSTFVLAVLHIRLGCLTLPVILSALQKTPHVSRYDCRYAWAAISEWQCHQGMTQGGRLSQSSPQGPAPDRHAMRRTRSVACMTQLQAKQKYGYEAPPADSDSPSSPER